MKIVYVSNAYPPHFLGGAELTAHGHAKVLRSLGHEVTVVAGWFVSSEHRPHIAVEEFEGVPIRRINVPPRHGTAVNFYNADVEALFDDVLAAHKPDVVHFHNLVGLSTGLIDRAKRQGHRTILTLHDGWGFCLFNTMLRRGEEICRDYTECSQCQAYFQDSRGRVFPVRLRNDFLKQQYDRLDAIVSSSRYLAREYLAAGFSPERMLAIGNGVDLDRFRRVVKSPPPPGEVRFSFMGYVGKHKGILDLLAALERLPVGSKVRVNIVGQGDLVPEVDAAVKALADRCTIVPWGKIPYHQIEAVLAQTDVMIVPSIWPENQPGTILEALATGTPVIATRLGGNLELLDDGENALLYEAGNSAALARRILHFVHSPESIATMGRAARAKVADFSCTRQVNAIVDVYKDAELQASEPTVPLVLLEGDRISDDVYAAIDGFADQPGAPAVRFALADWFPDAFPTNTAALVLTDRGAAITRARDAWALGIPVLAPSDHIGAANLGLGVRYDSFDDLVIALREATHRPAASTMHERRTLPLSRSPG